MRFPKHGGRGNAEAVVVKEHRDRIPKKRLIVGTPRILPPAAAGRRDAHTRIALPLPWGCGTLFGGRRAGLRLSDHAKGSAGLAPFTEPGSCPIGASNCPRRGRSLYGTARATARGISELPGLAAHRVGAADDGQLGRPDRFAACRADGPWPERWFREHYAHVFSLPPDEARQEMMRFFADPDQFEQIGLIPLGYNRAILLMAQAFHGTGETFGDSPETRRLSPHFEFYAA